MVGFIIETIVFLLSVTLTVWWFSSIILPTVYGFPMSIYLSLVKKTIQPRSVLIILIAPIICNLIIIGMCILLIKFFPSFVVWLRKRMGFFLGQWFALVVAVFYAFTKKGKNDIREDFFDFVRKFNLTRKITGTFPKAK